MQGLIILLAACVTAACSASTGSPASKAEERPVRAADPVRRGHADVDLTGAWTTGRGDEPAARQVVLQPQCNYSPGFWAIEQSGDTVRAWNFPARESKGTPSTEVVSKVPAVGWVSGVDLVLPTAGARYLLRYDSTTGHLRGTLNGEPIWAVRLEIVTPTACLAVP